MFLIKFYIDREIVMIVRKNCIDNGDDFGGIERWIFLDIFVEYNNNNKEIFIRLKKHNSRNKIFFLKEFIILATCTAFDRYELF